MAHWHRRGGNPDANQSPLVAFARRLGATVTITSQVGNGFADAVVGFREVNLLWEIKVPGSNPTKPTRTSRPRKLTKSEQTQKEFRERWAGRIETIESADDVLRSLLQADRLRPLDSGTVADDYLAAIVRAVRVNIPELTKGL